MDKQDTGLLLNPNNIKLQRNQFKQMCSLIGIMLKYRAPRENKHYDGYGELDSYYYEAEKVGCIFEEHPTIWTMRKMGWNSELQEGVLVVHVPYDLKNLQVGSLFYVPSGIDGSEDRLFKVIKMSTIAVYPASISCQIAPMWESNFEENDLDFKHNDFTLLAGEEDC